MNEMIIFVLFGVVINFLTVYFTRDVESIKQKAVNLHMLEDVYRVFSLTKLKIK